MNNLPNEILIHMMKNLSTCDIINFCKTNSEYISLLNDLKLWENKIKNKINTFSMKIDIHEYIKLNLSLDKGFQLIPLYFIVYNPLFYLCISPECRKKHVIRHIHQIFNELFEVEDSYINITFKGGRLTESYLHSEEKETYEDHVIYDKIYIDYFHYKEFKSFVIKENLMNTLSQRCQKIYITDQN